mgnify:CR=1 FL=1
MSNHKFGIGTWGFGSFEYGRITKKEIFGILDKAQSIPISCLDTAPLYGNGEVEKIIGKYIFSRRNKPFNIFTKFGLQNEQNNNREFSANRMIKSVETSLNRLNINQIDTLFIHSPTDTELLKTLEYESFFYDLLSSKKIKSIGLSTLKLEQIELLKNFKFISVVETTCHLLDLRILKYQNLLSNFRVVARSPLAHGFLTDNPPGKQNLPRNFRYQNAKYLSYFENNSNFFRTMSHDFGMKLEIFALVFLKSLPILTYIIPGVMSIKQLEQVKIANEHPNFSEKILDNILKISLEINKIF